MEADGTVSKGVLRCIGAELALPAPAHACTASANPLCCHQFEESDVKL